MKGRIAVGLCLMLGLSAAGCGDDFTASDRNNPELLAERGAYAVSVRETTVRYTPPGQEEERSLPVVVWYPSDEAEGRAHRLTLAGGFVRLPTRAFKGLPVASGGPHPVVVHSHGSGGEASLAYPAAEIFASRGWVVVSISHSGNTTMDSLSNPLDVPMYIPIYRMLDVSRTLDSAAEGFGWEDFAGHIDTNKVFMYGHSLGGYTSMAIGGATYLLEGAKALVCEDAGQNCEEGDITCGQHNPEACAFLNEPAIVAVTEESFRDPRVQAIALQAPGAIGMIDPSTVEVPSLLMSADQDAWLQFEREAQPIWNALHHPDDLWLRFKDAGHLSFITVCEENVLGPDLVNSFMPSVGGDGCNEEYMSSALMADINTAYMVMFAEKHLLGVSTWDAHLRGEKTLKLTEEVRMEASTHE